VSMLLLNSSFTILVIYEYGTFFVNVGNNMDILAEFQKRLERRGKKLG